MKTLAAAAQKVTVEQLAWVTACLALTLLTALATLPLWVPATVAVTAAIRLVLAARGLDAPPRAIRLGLSMAAIGLLFLQLHTFNGRTAGTTLLSLVAGLKLLETQTRRDIHVLTLIIYFLCLGALLEGESFWLLSYTIGVCWLTTATLLRLTDAGEAGDSRTSLRYAGRMLLQAVPLAIALWLFFPRFGGPLWQMPLDAGGATSGLSDSMSPGDISDLALSDEVAFRVRFAAGTPAAAERYWRGPVLHEFDGNTWRRQDLGPMHAPRLVYRGQAYQYTLSLEPSEHNWIYALDWPFHWDVGAGFLTSDYMLIQPGPLTQPLDVIATSYTEVQPADPLSSEMRSRDTALPAGRNPRSQRLAQDLRTAHPDDADYVRAVLEMFRQQPFFYTLTPPRLAEDSVDGFLFDTRRGFCGHYASAFALLMRAAGIPARVVTGYHGGTYNRFADYWIVRQSDAHAWDEIWIGQRWLRVDPTSMVAPERVEHGLNDRVVAGEPLTSRWQQRTPWLADVRLRLDALRLAWRERILRFDQSSQEHLLGWLGVPEPDGQKVALMLAACLVTGMLWLTWHVRRELHVRPRNPVDRAYDRLCRRMAAIGLARLPHEGPEAFAARIATQRPDLAAHITELCRRYSDLRYGGVTAPESAAAFIARARAFKPRRK